MNYLTGNSIFNPLPARDFAERVRSIQPQPEKQPEKPEPDIITSFLYSAKAWSAGGGYNIAVSASVGTTPRCAYCGMQSNSELRCLYCGAPKGGVK